MTGASLSQFNDSQNSASGDDNITIKVQTPSQKMMYRLSKVILFWEGAIYNI